MAGKELFAGFFATMMLVAPVFAQDEMDAGEEMAVEVQETRRSRFSPVITVKDIEEVRTVDPRTVQTAVSEEVIVDTINVRHCEPPTIVMPDGGIYPIVANKAYPYGTEINVPKKTRCRVELSRTPAAYIIVNAEESDATFTVRTKESFSALEIDVTKGNYAIYVSNGFTKDQVVLKTPIGAFDELVGHFFLNIETIDIQDKGDKLVSMGNNSYFTANTGTARYVGLHHSVPAVPVTTSFKAASTSSKREEELLGTNGTMDLALPVNGAGETTTFQLSEGATVFFTREKPFGCENWVVSFLTRYGNGQAKDFYCYVEGRAEPAFAVGNQIKPPKAVVAEATEEGEAAEGEGAEEEVAEEKDEMAFDDFDDLGGEDDLDEDFDDFDDDLM